MCVCVCVCVCVLLLFSFSFRRGNQECADVQTQSVTSSCDSLYRVSCTAVVALSARFFLTAWVCPTPHPPRPPPRKNQMLVSDFFPLFFFFSPLSLAISFLFVCFLLLVLLLLFNAHHECGMLKTTGIPTEEEEKSTHPLVPKCLADDTRTVSVQYAQSSLQ